MKNIAFIINPISGGTGNNKRKLPKLIDKELDRTQWLPTIVFTEYAGHATELARQFATMGFEAVVAVGGDGTVNEVARGLVESAKLKAANVKDTALGVVPLGSGNGFARHLHIPVNTTRAIQMLNRSEPIRCDYGLANDRLFVSTCGTGFDALIAYQFATSTKRGFKTYFENVVKDLVSYKPQTYIIKGDGVDIEHKAFLITFANAGQWGYEAYIAPQASVQDGLMDICMMSSSALLGAPGLALRLFTKSINSSLFMDTVRAKDVVVTREDESPFHIDGDPVKMPREIRIRIVPEGLSVLVEKRF